MRSRGGRIASIEPHGAILDLHRIDAQVVAAVDRRAGLQVEFPVVPVAGQHAIGVERAFHERIALVRTAVVAREDLALVHEQRDVPARDLHRDASRRRHAVDAPPRGSSA